MALRVALKLVFSLVKANVLTNHCFAVRQRLRCLSRMASSMAADLQGALRPAIDHGRACVVDGFSGYGIQEAVVERLRRMCGRVRRQRPVSTRAWIPHVPLALL